MSESSRDEQYVWDAVTAARNKAHEHHEYSLRLDEPNDLTLRGLEQLRKGQPGIFSEEDMEILAETLHDDGFRRGTLRGAEEMLAQTLAKLGVESLDDAELYVQRGKEGAS